MNTKKTNTNNKKTKKKKPRINGLQYKTIKYMRWATTPKKRSGTMERKKTSPYTNQQKRSSTESSYDIPKPKPGNVSLKRVMLNPEPRRAAKPPTDSDGSI